MRRVRIALGVAGAREAAARGDLTVVIDTLRASSTIVVALASGMRAVVPSLTPEEAGAAPGITAGERDGEKLPGLRHGNSPSEIAAAGYRGETLRLTTTNGTACIRAAAEGPAPVLVGCLLNAGAVARVLEEAAGEGRPEVTLLAAGWRERETVEDVLTATAIADRLGAEVLPGPVEPRRTSDLRGALLGSPSGKRLLGLGYRADVELCAQVDLHRVVPVYRAGELVPWPGGAG